MQRKTIAILVAIALGLIALAMLNQQDEQEALVRRLESRRQQDDGGVSLDPTREAYQPDSFQLTSNLVAERNPIRNTWVVHQGDGDAFVELPFAPTVDGKMPPAEPTTAVDQPDNPGYVGAAACASCHRERHDGFCQTAHHFTSGLAGEAGMRGHFAPPLNRLETREETLFVEMKRAEDEFVQEVHFEDWTMPVAVGAFTGSAKTGQTWLYWHGDALYQAHASYLSQIDRWIPSPGFRDITVNFSRRIRPACLECHLTYIQPKRPPNHYDPETAIWGISCERCHGPGRDHVAFHQQNSDSKIPMHIIHPGHLNRQAQLDICAQCHSGMFDLLGTPFHYRPGDDLTEHHRLENPKASGVGGIHTSNQLTRLKLSRCFQASQMTCTSCHDPHVNQRGDTKTFASACLNCHQVEHCGRWPEQGIAIQDRCIGCHMPVAENEGITAVAGGAFAVEMVDHYIRIPESNQNRDSDSSGDSTQRE